jgi:predicted membrane channel-forming protein YqfA (hemolysin III family)
MKNVKTAWIMAWIFLGAGTVLVLVPLTICLVQYFTYDAVNNSAPAATVFFSLFYTAPFALIVLSFAWYYFLEWKRAKKAAAAASTHQEKAI